MQDQNQKIEKVVESAAPGELPASLVAEIAQAGAIIILGEDDKGALTMRGTVPGGAFEPTTYAPHAFVQAVYDNYQDLVARVNGKITDAGRYRALRDFAVMAQVDKPRFEAVNAMLQKFEEGGAVPAETERTAADHDKFAEFLALAIQETEPDLVAPTVNPERDDTPQIILPGAPRIAH